MKDEVGVTCPNCDYVVGRIDLVAEEAVFGDHYFLCPACGFQAGEPTEAFT